MQTIHHDTLSIIYSIAVSNENVKLLFVAIYSFFVFPSKNTKISHNCAAI